MNIITTIIYVFIAFLIVFGVINPIVKSSKAASQSDKSTYIRYSIKSIIIIIALLLVVKFFL